MSISTSRTYRILCISEAMAPITHMSRSEGNESIVAREPAMGPRGVRWVPVLSGNALRHRCVREPGARWLVGEYGLAGKLSLMQLNFLFHGGNLTEGGGREDTARIADMQRLWPLVRLLGGCLPDQILAGSLLAGRGTLACEENRPALEAMLGDRAGVLPAALRPAEAFVSGYQYTRGDAAKTARGLLPGRDGGGDEGDAAGKAPDSNLMIFAGQAVTRGAIFVHEWILPNVSEVELGALAWSLRIWQGQGGTVGGQAARGHGRLATSVAAEDGVDLDGAAGRYLDHARAARDEAVSWLNRAFAPRAGKAAKGGTKATGKAEEVATSPGLLSSPAPAEAP